MTSRERETEGVVLRARTIQEDDLLIDLLTPDQGRMTALARHGRKSRRRFGTSLETLNLLRVKYEDRGTWAILKEAILETPLNGLAGNLQGLLAAFFAVDVIRQSTEERNPDRPLYQLLKETLTELDSGRSPPGVLADFEICFLEIGGWHPQLGACVTCRKAWREEGGFHLVFKEGGLFCSGCLPPYGHAELFTATSRTWVLARFIEFQLGRPLRSGRFLQKGLSE